MSIEFLLNILFSQLIMSSFSNIRFKLSDKETEWIEVPSERLQSSAYFQSLWERWQVLGGQFSAYSSDTLECELIIDIGQQKYYVTTSVRTMCALPLFRADER